MTPGNDTGGAEEERFILVGGHLFLRGNICHVAFEPVDVESEEAITGAVVAMLTHEWTVRLSPRGARTLFRFYRPFMLNVQQDMADEMGQAREERDERIQQFERRP